MGRYSRRRFLHREVQVDSKGLFVFYGSARYRPPTNTRVKQGMIVCFNNELAGYYNHQVQVFWNTEEFEIWGSKNPEKIKW